MHGVAITVGNESIVRKVLAAASMVFVITGFALLFTGQGPFYFLAVLLGIGFSWSMPVYTGKKVGARLDARYGTEFGAHFILWMNLGRAALFASAPMLVSTFDGGEPAMVAQVSKRVIFGTPRPQADGTLSWEEAANIS